VVIDPNDYPTKTTGNIPDGWTNQAIRAARDEALRAGKIPVFPHVAAPIEAMVIEARSLPRERGDHRARDPRHVPAGGGRSEVTIVWEEDGCLFRMRPDRIAAAMNAHGRREDHEDHGRAGSLGPHAALRHELLRRRRVLPPRPRARHRQEGRLRLPRQEQAAPHSARSIGPRPDGAAARRAQGRARDRHLEGLREDRPLARLSDRVAYPEAPRWQLQDEGVDDLGGGTNTTTPTWAGRSRRRRNCSASIANTTRSRRSP
jgi:hypothetical protein